MIESIKSSEYEFEQSIVVDATKKAQQEAAAHVVKTLDMLRALDPEAVHKLFSTRIAVNENVQKNPDLKGVLNTQGGKIGVIHIINSLLPGAEKLGLVTDEQGQIVGFQTYKPTL